MTEADSVLVGRDGPVTTVSINRPHFRNTIDGTKLEIEGVGR
jgi:enoyl-CoA hydratase